MSRYAPNCRWCGDRLGGCLYCVDENADNDGEKYLLIKQMIDRGEVHVLAIRHTEEVLLRQAGSGAPGIDRTMRSDAPRFVCTHHLWAHDGNDFKRRHCTRPGCPVRQRFVWLPEDPNRCGEWLDESAIAERRIGPAAKLKKARRIKRERQKV